MFIIDENWKKENGQEFKNLEYRVRDFYGPFLEMRLRKMEDGKLIVWPIRKTIETAEYSESDFSLICKAAKEIFEITGKFTLKIPYRKIEIEVNSADTNVEELILDKLKKLKLF